MAFDPDKYLAQYGLDENVSAEKNLEAFDEEGKALERPGASDFDPDAYLIKYENSPKAAAPEAAPAKSPSLTESAIRGGAQGLSLGFADEFTGMVDAARNASSTPSLSELPAHLAQEYRKGRDESRTAYEAAEKANPKTFLGGEVAGGILPFLTGAGAAGTAAKGLSTGARILKGLPTAAKLGAAVGLGQSKADLTKGEFGEAAIDTGVGATTGAVTHGIVEGAVTPLVRKVGEKLAPTLQKLGEKLAKESGLDALRYMEVPDKVLLEEIGIKKFPTEAAAKQAASGELASVISKHDLLKVMGGPRAVLQRIEDAAIGNRQKFQPMLDEVDGTLNKMFDKAKAMNPEQAAQQFEGEKQRAMMEFQDLVIKEIDEAKKGGRDPVPLAKWASEYGANIKESVNDIHALNELKQNLRETLNQVDWGKASADLSDKAAIIRKTYGFLMRRMEELGNIAKPGLGDDLAGLNKEYNSLSVLKKAMDSKVGGALGQQTTTLAPYKSAYPYLAAGAALTSHPVIAGLLGAVYGAEKITGQKAGDLMRMASSGTLDTLATTLQGTAGEVPQGLIAKLLRAAADPDNMSRAATLGAVMSNKQNEEAVQNVERQVPKDVQVRVHPKIAPDSTDRGFVTIPSADDIDRLKAIIPDDNDSQHIALRNILEEAKRRDQSGRNALLFALKQNPAYRQMLNKFEKEQVEASERSKEAQSR